MITIEKHSNFGNWFQVYFLSDMLEEFNKKSKAIRFAKRIAKENSIDKIQLEEELIEV